MSAKVASLALSIIVLCGFAQGTPVCNTQLQLSLFLNDSYSAHADLVRFGVPSVAVSTFYNDALKYLAQNCGCGPTLLDEPCTDTTFNADKEVTALRALLDSDEALPSASRLFRLYDSQKTLDPLTSIQQQKLQLGLDLLNTNTHNLDVILSLGWQRVQFPSDDSFFQDDSSAQTAACTSFDSIAQNGGITYPASATTAYVLSLVQNVRKVGGDLTAAEAILANHTSFVFDGVRCHKLSGDKLKLPIGYMKDFKAQTQLLLDASGNTSLTADLNNVRAVAGTSKFYLYPLVDKFSSLISYGDSETVLYTSTEKPGGDLVERIQVDSVLQSDVSLSMSSSLTSAMTGMFGMNNNAGGPTCPPGWILVSRAVSLMSADEECCSDVCELLALSLSDPFLWSIEQENCCADCNLFVCQDQSLLPASVPLSAAPPVTYPTSVDL